MIPIKLSTWQLILKFENIFISKNFEIIFFNVSNYPSHNLYSIASLVYALAFGAHFSHHKHTACFKLFLSFDASSAFSK